MLVIRSRGWNAWALRENAVPTVLPEKLSADGLIDVLNALMTREEFLALL